MAIRAAIITVAILTAVAIMVAATTLDTTLTGITRTITIVRIIMGLIVHPTTIMGLITRLHRSIS
jgi:hypothetical protein